MSRPKKDNHPMSIRIATSIYERLCAYCEDSGQPKTVAIERALTMFIDDYDDKMKLINKQEKGD